LADPLAAGRDVTADANSVLPPSPVSREAVAIRIADFLVRTEKERLDLFRLHLHATVRSASPLLLDLATHQGIDLQRASGLVRPPRDWPWRPIEDHPSVPLSRSLQRKATLGGSTSAVSRAFEHAFAIPGVVIRGVAHPAGRFGIRPTAAVLGFTAAVGPCLLSAFGASATLKFGDPMPEALMLSMPGRPIDNVVHHPILEGRGYVIRRTFVDPIDGAPVIEFRARPVAFEMPLGTLKT